MKKATLATLALTFLVQNAFAASVEKQLFTLEKSLNSENILLIHSQTDENCKFVQGKNGLVDFYWLMDGITKKEVHPMIRSKVAERITVLSMNADKTSFKIRLNDLSEIRHDLQDNTAEIVSEINNGNCEVKSILKLGASANYRKLNLKRTYCEVEKNFVGIPKGCKFLDLQGLDADTKEIVKVRFKGK